jgi:hypothetical protein
MAGRWVKSHGRKRGQKTLDRFGACADGDTRLSLVAKRCHAQSLFFKEKQLVASFFPDGRGQTVSRRDKNHGT